MDPLCGRSSNWSGTATLTHVVMAGNRSGGDGGGLANFGTVKLVDCTAGGNTCKGSFGGGGIANFNKSATSFVVEDSIITGNSLAGGKGRAPDAFGVFDSLGGNIVGDRTGSSGWTASDN